MTRSKPRFDAVLVWVLAISLAACGVDSRAATEKEPGRLVFKPLDREYCPGHSIDVTDSRQAAVDSLAAGAGEAELLAHFRDLRCLSAHDFKVSYDAMIEGLPDASAAWHLAPLVFVYFDMGARLIDDRARRWLLSGSRSTDADAGTGGIRFYAVSDINLRRLPAALHPGLLRSLAGGTWLTRCSLGDMAWTDGGVPYCPGDDVCPVLRHTLGQDQIEAMPPGDVEALCEEICRLGEGSDTETLATRAPELEGLCGAESGGSIELPKVTREGILACLDDYLDATPDPNARFACIIETRRSTLDFLMNLRPQVAVTVSDYCKLASRPVPDPKEELEKRRAELVDQKDRITDDFLEEMDEKYPLPPFPGSEEDAEYRRMWDDYLKEIRWRNEEIKEIDRQLKKIEEERKRWPGYAPARRCAQDDFTCSDECSIQDQQRKAFYECITRDLDQPEVPVTPLDPEDPEFPEPDPDVTDPPDDAPSDDPAFVALVDCVSGLLTPGSDECSRDLRCMDGSTPTRNEEGLCACPAGEGLPGELPCDSVLECAFDEPCTCPDDPGGAQPVPAPKPGTVLTIES